MQLLVKVPQGARYWVGKLMLPKMKQLRRTLTLGYE